MIFSHILFASFIMCEPELESVKLQKRSKDLIVLLITAL